MSEQPIEVARQVAAAWRSLTEPYPQRPWGQRSDELESAEQERFTELLDALADAVGEMP